MSALMEPDDGPGPITRVDLHFSEDGRFRFTAFPVRWDTEGETTAIAVERLDTETGEADFKILGLQGEPMTGCACRDCAPHEQDGPLPLGYASRVNPRMLYEVACPKCGAAVDAPCTIRGRARNYFAHAARRYAWQDKLIAEGRA